MPLLSSGASRMLGRARAKWYLAGGAPLPVAAYQPKGAASLAASYINLAQPGTYNAAPGVAPTWAAATGWTFDGAAQYITTGIVPAVGWSLLARFSNAASGYREISGTVANSPNRFFAVVLNNASRKHDADRAPGGGSLGGNGGSLAHTPMRTLLIAPHSTHAGLPDAEREVQHVANALDARLLMGGVTVHDVLAALDDAYDCVWFACHGTEDGIVLSDGVLPAARLVQMLRARPPHLVVLNTCSSLRTAMHVHDTLHCAVVATITDVFDLTAFVTGSLLARGLAEGLSIADAYARSLPGDNREYVLLNGSLRMGNADPFDDLKALLAHALKRQDRIHDDIAAVRAELDAARPRLIHLLTWSAGYALLVVALLLTATAVTLGLDLPETLAIVSLLAALAGGLLWRGRNLT